MPADKPWLTAEENSWWSATGKTAAAKAFTNALALTLPGSKFAVLTGVGVMELVPAANVTAATRMALVDAEWLERADAQSGQITGSQAAIENVRSICDGWRSRSQPQPPEVLALIDLILPVVGGAA